MSRQEINQDSIETPESVEPMGRPGQFASPKQTPPPRESPLESLHLAGGNVLLIVMFVVGAGAIYLLNLRTRPVKASAEQIRMESEVNIALSQLSTIAQSPDMAASTTDITDVFYHQARQRQIPIRQLQGNPFIFRRFTPYPVTASLQRSGPTDEQQQELKDLKEAMETVKSLKLESVLSGEQGKTAMICNNLLTEGERIRGWTVAEIRPHEVVIRWKRHTYVLKMPE